MIFFFFFFIYLFSTVKSEITCKKQEILGSFKYELKLDPYRSPCHYFIFDNLYEKNYTVVNIERALTFSSQLYLYDNESEIKFNGSEPLNYKEKLQIGVDFKNSIRRRFSSGKHIFLFLSLISFVNDRVMIYSENFEENPLEIYIDKYENRECLDLEFEYGEKNPVLFLINQTEFKYLRFQFIPLSLPHNSSFSLSDSKSFQKLLFSVRNSSASGFVNIPPGEVFARLAGSGNRVCFEGREEGQRVKTIGTDGIDEDIIVPWEEFYYKTPIQYITSDDDYIGVLTVKLDFYGEITSLSHLYSRGTVLSSDEDLLKQIPKKETDNEGLLVQDEDFKNVFHFFFLGNRKLRHILFNLGVSGGGGGRISVRLFPMVSPPNYLNFTHISRYNFPVFLQVDLSLFKDVNNGQTILFTNKSNSLTIYIGKPNIKEKKMSKILTKNQIAILENNKEWIINNLNGSSLLFLKLFNPSGYEYNFFEALALPTKNKIFSINDKVRDVNKSLLCQFDGVRDTYYYIGLYKQFESHILYKELIYGKAKFEYKGNFEGNSINDIFFGKGFSVVNDTFLVRGDIDLIRITPYSPTLSNIHFIHQMDVSIQDNIYLPISLSQGSRTLFPLNKHTKISISFDTGLLHSRFGVEVGLLGEGGAALIETDNKTFNLSTSDIIRFNHTTSLDSISFTSLGNDSLINLLVGYPNNIPDPFVIEYKENFSSKRMRIIVKNLGKETHNICYRTGFGVGYMGNIPREGTCLPLGPTKSSEIRVENPYNKYLNESSRRRDDSYFVWIGVLGNKGDIEVKNNEEQLNTMKISPYEHILYNKTLKYPLSLNPPHDNYTNFSHILVQIHPRILQNNKENNKNIVNFQLKFSTDAILYSSFLTPNSLSTLFYENPFVDTILYLEDEAVVKYGYVNVSEGFDVLKDNFSVEYNEEEGKVKFRNFIRGHLVKYSVIVMNSNLHQLNDFMVINKIIRNPNLFKDIVINSFNVSSGEEFLSYKIPFGEYAKKDKAIIGIYAEEVSGICEGMYEVVYVGFNSGSSLYYLFLLLLLVPLGFLGFFLFSKFKKKKNDKDLGKLSRILVKDSSRYNSNLEE